MLVCHCKSVTEREVRRAIQSGACTHRDIARACGAGSVCGGCQPVLDELIEADAPAAAAVAPGFACELAAAS